MNASNKTIAAAMQATPVDSFTPNQIERLQFLSAQWLDRLKRSTGCDLLAPLKQVVRVTGGGAPQSIRNRGNRINIDGQEVQGYLVLGKICFDLQQIAAALAAAEVTASADAPNGAPVKNALGRPRKPALSLSGASA